MNRKAALTTAYIITVSFVVLVGARFIHLARANPLPVCSLKMPQEYINYTIARVNGSLWAKVDGTYPLTKFDIECQDQSHWANNTGFTFTGDTLPMVYPTPPGTTNISVELNETALPWSNHTQIHPNALHPTALGDWTMISCTIQPIPDYFILKIHYEHPIELINGSHTFLYDLNISPYLSPWSNKSTAYFNINFETNYTELQVNTIAVNGTSNPVDYTVTEENETETVTLEVVSEYSKPLLGDLLISFTQDKELEQPNSDFTDSSLTMGYGYVLAAVTVVIATVVGYLFIKRLRRPKQKVTPT